MSSLPTFNDVIKVARSRGIGWRDTKGKKKELGVSQVTKYTPHLQSKLRRTRTTAETGHQQAQVSCEQGEGLLWGMYRVRQRCLS